MKNVAEEPHIRKMLSSSGHPERGLRELNVRYPEILLPNHRVADRDGNKIRFSAPSSICQCQRRYQIYVRYQSQI